MALLEVVAVLTAGGWLLLGGGYGPIARVLGEILAKASGPAAPTIASGPSAPTASTTAAFTYTDSQSGVSFVCSLDGAKFQPCPTTGKTYTGLADGAHTFSVEAQFASGPSSSAASRNWSVDTTPPAIALTFPANGANYNAGSYNAGCPTAAGVCGSAADATGVQAVTVSIRQGNGNWWGGTSFNRTSEFFNTATLGTAGTKSTTWRLGLLLPTDGVYTAHVRAADTLGNATSPSAQAAADFNIDTMAPPVPVIISQPDNPTAATSASFTFTDTEAGVGFQCRLDGGTFGSCPGSSANSGTAQYTNLSVGDHCFYVRALDAARNASGVASSCWTIVLNNTFPIGGKVTQPFTPGVTQPLNLVFTNPFNFAIKVTSVSVTVQAGTTHTSDGTVNPACSGTQNMTVTRAFSGTVTVPSNATGRSLSDLNVPQNQWPLVQMPDLSTSQDGCKNTTFHFTFTGTAIKA